jgi:Divergent InlB B-repeat domain/Metallo-peptidase family M12B Reprolysin-like/Viral BACON domain
MDQLPVGRLRRQLQALPPAAQQGALGWLRSFHFTGQDLPSLHADAQGGIFYACGPAVAAAPATAEPPPIGQAAVPMNPFPAGLIFHSRPGSPNVFYLNFTGETVTNTQWNTEISRAVIPAVAFSTDSDFTTFSDAEQVAIKRIWQRVAEDYAPFNIDVTTERPATFDKRTAHALITRNTDVNGDPNPYSVSGGVAYVNSFGTTSYANYRPAWIYYNNLAANESYIAEAASHEIGHNLGLSHDGKTDGTEYYGGHGSGDISWGPVMGTGYNRNVSQWCKGEYYLANNTQDDLATMAGKISYRPDDHGNTAGTATALVLTGGTNIVSTTPENDPANTNTANKGVLERNTDVDVFSFVTGSGPVSLTFNPWIMSADTRGGNLDVLLELYNEAGTLLLSSNPGSKTTSLIQTNLSEGRYYLHVRNSGAGDPLSSSPTGYTAYGSIGQYFISGYVTPSTGFIAPPLAELQAADLTQSGQTTAQFAVTYSDDVAVDVSTIDSNDVRVTGPNGFDQLAQFVSLNLGGNGMPRTATYSVAPAAGGVWSPADNGSYAVFMETNQVGDTEGAWVAAGRLGEFRVAVPVTIYSANMDTDPGWTLDPQWQYGTPAYGNGGPTSGFTGSKILGYNLSGNYANNLSPKYATTPPINCSGSSTVTLRFRRWLRTKVNDIASIEVSTDGTTWSNVWSSFRPVSDASWQELQNLLPAGVAGSSTVQLRWGLDSNPAQNELGWNLDDVELLGDGSLDTTPPLPSLNVADLTLGGSPSHSCSVTYTDDTAVRLSSLDSNDLVVTGPNGYSNLLEFVGADLPMDGSPVTATYSIPAPGGTWDAGDNGTYTLTLVEGAVEDTLNNTTPQTVLGSFNVSISTASPGVLEASPAGGLSSIGTEGGPFNPSSIVYTLSNSGSSTLNWTASKVQDWLDLSATDGTLPAGGATNVTVSVKTNANGLADGTYTDSIAFVNATSGNGTSSRDVSLTITIQTTFELNVTVNQPAWGAVSPASGAYAGGSSMELVAAPARYFQFQDWGGDVSGTNNPLPFVLTTNLSVLANFAEVYTTNFPTPLWWLANYGYTNAFETAVSVIGANGMPLWQSYVAGLNPYDPNSRFLLSGRSTPDGTGYVLNWNTVTDRVYTLWSSSNLSDGFAPVPGATNLPWTIQSLTNPIDGAPPWRFYRMEVQKP